LNRHAREFWERIIFSKSADWFNKGSFPILAQYCHICANQAELILQRNGLNVLKPVDVLERTALSNARIRLNKSIIDHANAAGTLATKLRLTVQAIVDRKSGVRLDS
jgi:hypothetical protein